MDSPDNSSSRHATIELPLTVGLNVLLVEAMVGLAVGPSAAEEFVGLGVGGWPDAGCRLMVDGAIVTNESIGGKAVPVLLPPSAFAEEATPIDFFLRPFNTKASMIEDRITATTRKIMTIRVDKQPDFRSRRFSVSSVSSSPFVCLDGRE